MHYRERRADGEVANLEAAPRIVVVVRAWMLDPVACAGMEIGPARVSVGALQELHRLLIALGFRRGSSADPVEETRDANPP